MRGQWFMTARQLKLFTQFLEEHPNFSPLLVGEDAHVCGFQVGGTFLAIDDLERMIGIQPHFDRQQAALLLMAPAEARGRRG